MSLEIIERKPSRATDMNEKLISDRNRKYILNPMVKKKKKAKLTFIP